MGNCCKWLFKNQDNLKIVKQEVTVNYPYGSVQMQSNKNMDDANSIEASKAEANKSNSKKLPQIKNSSRPKQQSDKSISTQPITSTTIKSNNNIIDQSRVQILMDNKPIVQKSQERINKSSKHQSNNNLPLSIINQNQNNILDDQDVQAAQNLTKLELQITDSYMVGNSKHNKASNLKPIINMTSSQIMQPGKSGINTKTSIKESDILSSVAPLNNKQSSIHPSLKMVESQMLNSQTVLKSKHNGLPQSQKPSETKRPIKFSSYPTIKQTQSQKVQQDPKQQDILSDDFLNDLPDSIIKSKNDNVNLPLQIPEMSKIIKTNKGKQKIDNTTRQI